MSQPDAVTESVRADPDFRKSEPLDGFIEDQKGGQGHGDTVLRHSGQPRDFPRRQGKEAENRPDEFLTPDRKVFQPAGLDVFLAEKAGVGVGGLS